MFAASKCFSGYAPTPMQKNLSSASSPRLLLYELLPWYDLMPSTSSLAYLYPPGVGVKRFSPAMLSPRRATILLMPRKAMLSSLLSISSIVLPPHIRCGTTSTSYFDMIAAHTVVSLMRLRRRWRLNVPSASSRYSNSSLWLVTFMYFGLNSMNGAMLSKSSSFVIPLSGGTISIEGYAFLLAANISDIFIILLYCVHFIWKMLQIP